MQVSWEPHGSWAGVFLEGPGPSLSVTFYTVGAGTSLPQGPCLAQVSSCLHLGLGLDFGLSLAAHA
jgi:hypothetical protein